MPLTAGYNGTLNTSVTGLAQSTVTPATLDDAVPFNSNSPAASSSTDEVDVDDPGRHGVGSFRDLRRRLSGREDVDVYVYQNVGRCPASRRAERRRDRDGDVTFRNPPAGANLVMFENAFDTGSASTITAMPNVYLVPNSERGEPDGHAGFAVGDVGELRERDAELVGPRDRPVARMLTYDDGTNTIGRTIVAVDNH